MASPAANQAFESSLTCRVNELLLSAGLEGETSFRQFVRQVKQSACEARSAGVDTDLMGDSCDDFGNSLALATSVTVSSSGTTSISGKVYRDFNSDGQLSEIEYHVSTPKFGATDLSKNLEVEIGFAINTSSSSKFGVIAGTKEQVKEQLKKLGK